MFHLPKIKASKLWEKARMGEIQLTHDGWYLTVLEATGDAELANQIANQHSRERLRNNMPLE